MVAHPGLLNSFDGEVRRGRLWGSLPIDEDSGLTTEWALEDRIVAAIRRIIRAVDVHSRKLVDEFGLTGPQLATLQEATRLGPVSPGALARSVHLSAATMTGILARLEKRGLVARARGTADRRRVEVTVTDAGREAIARAPSLLQERFLRELAALEDWERHMMLASLQRIASMMDAEDLDAAPHLTNDAIGTREGDGEPAVEEIAPAHLELEPFDGWPPEPGGR